MTSIKYILTVVMFFTTASVVTLTMFTTGGKAYGQEETVQSNPASNQTTSQGFS